MGTSGGNRDRNAKIVLLVITVIWGDEDNEYFTVAILRKDHIEYDLRLYVDLPSDLIEHYHIDRYFIQKCNPETFRDRLNC